MGAKRHLPTFGGVPPEVLFDQMKAVIVEDHRLDGGKFLENAEFLRLAAHWGFRMRARRPYRAATYCKDERPIVYLRSNLFYERDSSGTRISRRSGPRGSRTWP
ncbi:MAG: Transposase [Gemmatimonadetes bacterium]|nr:Transposase [Gemmatimonadota bacterium]